MRKRLDRFHPIIIFNWSFIQEKFFVVLIDAVFYPVSIEHTGIAAMRNALVCFRIEKNGLTSNRPKANLNLFDFKCKAYMASAFD